MAHTQEYIFSLLNALKLKYFGEVLKQDISQLLPTEQELLFKHVAKWLEAETNSKKNKSDPVTNTWCLLRSSPDCRCF